jgi:proteasome accessory factor B
VQQRLHRVLRILRLLQGAQPYSASQLCIACGVARRTIYRDLNAIEQAGFTIWYDRQARSYKVHSRDFMPPLSITEAEAGDLIATASAFGGANSIPLLEGARGAVEKLLASLPLNVKSQTVAADHATEIRLGPTSRHNSLQPVFDMVREAIRHSVRLEGIYLSPGEATRFPLSLDPYWLVFHRHAWYVIGHSSHHGKVTTLKLGRFRSLTRTTQSFCRPQGYTLEKYLGNAWGILPGDKSYNVQFRFSPLLSPYVAEINWHRTQQVRWDDNGQVILSAKVDGLDEIAWWVHEFGAHVEILAPEALRERVASLSSPSPSPDGKQPFGLFDI